MAIQDIVKDIMHKEGITQVQLAECLGVTRQAVNQMLNGSDIRVSTLNDILYVMGYRLSIERDNDD